MGKTRKIAYYYLEKSMWVNNAAGLSGIYPLFLISDVVRFILTKKGKDRNVDLKNDKACSLQSATIKTEKAEEYTLITGLFRSAQSKYRPPLWDIKTDEERDSPKKMTEGDKEKTHFAIKITKEDVFLLLENNGNGVNINHLIGYFTKFTKLYLKSIKKPKNFTIGYSKMAKDNFLAELDKLKRTQKIIVSFNKSLVGGDALNFSNRTSSLKTDVQLTMTADRNHSAKETAIDVYNFFSLKKASDAISKIRILGKGENNEDTSFDTSFVEKIETIDVAINDTTGQVQSTEMYSFFKMLIKSL